MFEIRKYNDADKEVWNAYVEHARNATFLFNRNYMDYHSDRFKDYSLMFYKNGKLHSLLPAHEREEIFCSHFGLTYGGLIMNKDVTAADVVQLFKELNEYLRQQGFKRYYTNLCLGFTTRCHPKKIFMPSIGYVRHVS